uniref:Polyketide synthase n=1 Tax=Pestalotiopsis microspora TaxID=85828 RepID=A0A1P8NTH6_PESMI|nr:polyketide synthase [Pestalotiopsis microspora]
MPAQREYSVLLFGGQGSTAIFSPHAFENAEQDVRSASAGSILLSRCHAAFLREIACLEALSRERLAIDVEDFSSARDLLRPAEKYHTNAIIQATTIYLCQMLHYLAEIQKSDTQFEEFYERIRETAGFSSGLLPATIIARSRTLDELVTDGVEGFCLAFWIACRSLLFGIEATQKHPTDDTIDAEATWSLVIRGLSSSQLEERLDQHFNARESDVTSQDSSRHLQVSAISSANVVSVSGPSSELDSFRTQAVPDLTTTYAHVYGWYHGGDQFEDVVDQVLRDLQWRSISLRPCSGPTKPVRSTLDGSLLETSGTSPSELLEWLVRHLLVHPVNWSETAREIGASVNELLSREPASAIKVMSFGPSSGALFPDSQSFDPRIQLLDMSPFKAGKSSQSHLDYKDSIAIVGMSVNLPKGKGTEQLWETLSQGLSAVSEIPDTRFKVSEYYSEDSGKPRSMPARHGAFLDDPFSFDNGFFNISPREAKSMDPQQRVLLHTAQEAFEDAGYVADSSPSFQRGSTGCYIGLATGDYTDNLRDDIDVFYSPGTLRAFHSGRISYYYRLSGPSIVTDTACSSSMVSVYQACRALQAGDCTSAIAGGVNVISSPDMYLGLARGHFLSPTGGCKPFDAGADGYCRAEGCVLFVLKLLSDAVAENDRIHGVIRNVMTNQSGNAHSITHPHSATQIDLFQRLLRRTNVDPGSVGVVEAHGTGTQAGDAREIDSLKTVFGPYHSKANPLVISSIKGNIGHCEAASGAAGLAKLLLMLQKKEVPSQAGFKNINPAFADIESSGFVIPRHTVAWKHSLKTPRRALLNNFGAAGSNASLLLEEWDEPLKSQRNRPKLQKRSAHVFRLSAKSPKALQSAIERHYHYIHQSQQRHGGVTIQDICYTATARRQIHDHRVSLVCTSVEDLTSKLEHCQAAASPTTAQHVSASIFVFSGQGGLYDGMAEELMQTSSIFKDTIQTCDGILQGLGHPSILSIFSRGSESTQPLVGNDHIVASQCACVALEYALAKMFMSWGVTPKYVMGHSLGEYAALCVAEVLTLEDTLRIVASRAKMMTECCLPDTSGMLACKLSPTHTEKLLSASQSLSQLSVVCRNGLSDCVVGGPLDQLDVFRRECIANKIKVKLLDVPYAFHSAAMDPIMEPLKALGKSVHFARPKIPIISNVFGRFFEQGDLSNDYFALHASKSVQFAEGIADLQSREDLNDTLFLELGPHPTTLPMLRSSIQSDSCAYLGTLKQGEDSWASISSTMAALSLRKIAINWGTVFDGTSAKVTSLPGHPLQGATYLIPYTEPRTGASSHPDSTDETLVMTHFRLLPWMNRQTSLDSEYVFETTLATLSSLILGHDVGGTPICPASVFHELALEASHQALAARDDQVLVVSKMSFASPLIYTPAKDTDLLSVYIKKLSTSLTEFSVTSRASRVSEETVHCSGTVQLQHSQTCATDWVRDAALAKRQIGYFHGAGEDCTSTFRRKVLYETIFPRVVAYSAEYQTLISLDVADSNLEGLGAFRLPPNSHGDFLAPPIFTDTLLHSAGFIANLTVKSEEICICARVDSIELLYKDINYTDTFSVYCSLLEVKGAILADSIALDPSGKVVAVVRGMEFKRLRLSAFQQMLSGKAITPKRESMTLTPEKPRLSNGLMTPPTSGDALNTPVDSGGGLLHKVRAALETIVMDVGGFSKADMDYTKSLDELGIDSLMQIEIISKLTRTFPGQTGLNHHALSSCETLEALENTLASILHASVGIDAFVGAVTSSSRRESCQLTLVPSEYSPSDTVQDNPVKLHHSTGHATPLCLFHDGSGQISMYSRLQGHDRSTYAFFDPQFGSDQRQLESVYQMAQNYVSKITKVEQGPIIVGGWSFGGVVAFEAARQLMANGFEVRGLVLIDSPNPINHEPLPKEVITSVTKHSSRVGASSESTAMGEEFLYNASLLGAYEAIPLPDSRLSKLRTVMLRSQDVMDTESLCGVSYEWLSNQDARSAAIVAWEGLVGGHVEVLSIPGNHFEPFSRTNIQATGAQLWRACQYIEQGDN